MPLKVLAIFNWSCCFVHFAKLYLIWISSLIWLISVLMWVSIVLSFSPNILLLWSSNLSISFSIFISPILEVDTRGAVQPVHTLPFFRISKFFFWTISLKVFKMKIDHLFLKIPVAFSSLFRVIWTISSKY